MPLSFLVGDDFHAKDEAEGLIIQLSKTPAQTQQLYAAIDVWHSLGESRNGGFNAIRHKWQGSGVDQLFVYSHMGILAAINVPGSGRGQTRDLTFVGIRLIEGIGNDEVPLTHLTAFLETMGLRRRIGKEHVWIWR